MAFAHFLRQLGSKSVLLPPAVPFYASDVGRDISITNGVVMLDGVPRHVVWDSQTTPPDMRGILTKTP